jgi:hypothetical protein
MQGPLGALGQSVRKGSAPSPSWQIWDATEAHFPRFTTCPGSALVSSSEEPDAKVINSVRKETEPKPQTPLALVCRRGRSTRWSGDEECRRVQPVPSAHSASTWSPHRDMQPAGPKTSGSLHVTDSLRFAEARALLAWPWGRCGGRCQPTGFECGDDDRGHVSNDDSRMTTINNEMIKMTMTQWWCHKDGDNGSLASGLCRVGLYRISLSRYFLERACPLHWHGGWLSWYFCICFHWHYII